MTELGKVNFPLGAADPPLRTIGLLRPFRWRAADNEENMEVLGKFSVTIPRIETRVLPSSLFMSTENASFDTPAKREKVRTNLFKSYQANATDGETIDDLRTKRLGQNVAHYRGVDAIVRENPSVDFPTHDGKLHSMSFKAITAKIIRLPPGEFVF